MNSKKNENLYIFRDKVLIFFLILSIITVISQITLGGIVRVTGSGDGCPDWPKCYDSWIPPFEYHALIEYAHRTLGASLGIFIFTSTSIVWIKYRRNSSVIRLVTLSSLLVFIVGMIGGVVVLSELSPSVRTLHLTLAQMVTALVILSYIFSAYTFNIPINKSSKWLWSKIDKEHKSILNFTVFAAIFTLVALLSGSYAVWKEAGTVCSSWPLCGGSVIPQSYLAWIHMFHRFISILSVFVVFIACYKVLKTEKISKHLRFAAISGIGLIFAQIIMGAANPLTTFEQWARAGHLSLATLIWVNMVFMIGFFLKPTKASAINNIK